jgi:Protein of unknown function (DUF1579)
MLSRLTLTLVCILSATMCHRTTAQESDGDKVLGRFVGTWKIDGKAHPSKWAPDSKKISEQESTVWALQKRLILIRAVDPVGHGKSLFIVTHDPEKKVYPLWGFDSSGLAGAEWELTWDPKSNATIGHAVGLPLGWTSNGTNQFPDAETNNVTAWIKDDVDELLLRREFTKKRLPEKDEPAVVAAWKKHDQPDDLPAELKVLDRMIGTWDTISLQKPAVWTPDGGHSTATVKREWILNGRFIIDTSLHSNGEESLALIGYDTQRNAYRNWWFNSEGHRGPSQGQWNERTQTLSYVGEPQDGKTTRSSVRFADPDHEVYEIKVTDDAGKVYLDMDIIATRRSTP